ncbi:hypothetical protein N7508_007163 [Penicillium antarcticum]|uniref:uncharacterized protein n=1 Tax=Penicillium antarcticum TaxID=416450 RepID=UPI00239C7DD6|nr:uncharacterized protein N7508_007163 [Penicillium antarcticum]KAJ5302300.1 hypothetical protein N7508_007163 [Penicillium antarcticum]
MERCVEQLLPVEKYPSRKNNAMIHSCCWEVAWNVLGRPPLKDSWLAQFTSHLVYLRPFATKTLFDCETNDIDHELWAETPSRDRIESAGKQDTQGALHSMIQEASSWLERNPGIVCIDDVQKMDQFLAFCLIKGIPYQLATDKDTDIRPHLRRALQSLKASATSRLPKTFNLWVAWNNTKSALDSFRSLPRPRPLTLDPELYGLTAVIKYSVPAEQCHRLIFSFRTRPVPHPGSWPMLELVMFAYDGKVIGSAGLAGRNLSVSLTIQSLRGIHIVQDRAGSITAIRVRDGQRWTAWYGAPKLGSHDSEHEWESPEKNLVINYDIIGVGVKSRVSDLPC